MKLSQPVRLGAWILIGLNLLMSFGAIWIFMRMAPAIEIIIAQNQVSLQACEHMLAAVAMQDGEDPAAPQHLDSFTKALDTALNNITEPDEPGVLGDIRRSYAAAFAGNGVARRQTVAAILRLGEINRAAMIKADGKARQLGYAGAWGVVFMASGVFLTGLLFLRSLKKNLVDPLEEIDAVVGAFRHGDTLRRCTTKDGSRNIKQVFGNVNELLDGCCIPKGDGWLKKGGEK